MEIRKRWVMSSYYDNNLIISTWKIRMEEGWNQEIQGEANPQD